MRSGFLLYGANGYVGEYAARLAKSRGLECTIAGRNAHSIAALAQKLAVPSLVFDLSDSGAIAEHLQRFQAVLHCAGPYMYTSKPMADACMTTGCHYLDLTGEMAVFQALADRDAEAKAAGVMLLPGVGFDVVPTDCLALHLKQRLPSATHLTLAFSSTGPAGLPPGTQHTAIELLPYGNLVRSNGKLQPPGPEHATRKVDFGKGQVTVTRLTWGDVFTAYYSTGIPNIEEYVGIPAVARWAMQGTSLLGGIISAKPVKKLLHRLVLPGPTEEQRSRTTTHIWGEAIDERGNKASARLHGPEAGLHWTADAALLVVDKVLSGHAPSGFQTPAKAYGADLVMSCKGVQREDV